MKAKWWLPAALLVLEVVMVVGGQGQRGLVPALGAEALCWPTTA
jgi:hypothetical protein